MLVIGHRGAAGLARENSMDALRAGIEAGADILEFDVRLTKDKIPVVVHDFHTLRTHHDMSIISRLTLEELRKRTKDQPIFSLAQVLDEFFGVILLNIELKGRGSGRIVAELIKKSYIRAPKDWDNVLLSSFKGGELAAVRHVSELANLALLHSENPFLFIAYHRKLRLSAVGFHRLYINRFALEIAKRTHLFIYAYTVNRPHTALMLAQQHIDGIVTDTPNTILSEIKKHAV
ncbi:MAG TPA: glycerophosphodiester phosphodiesterase [Candidatus Saccharimonadales bacterium]|nr:glycerophosphodiester phosphodiesterase [Candidatus Saccharimonadales bacterium]